MPQTHYWLRSGGFAQALSTNVDISKLEIQILKNIFVNDFKIAQLLTPEILF
jgi:hypothetical protein